MKGKKYCSFLFLKSTLEDVVSIWVQTLNPTEKKMRLLETLNFYVKVYNGEQYFSFIKPEMN